MDTVMVAIPALNESATIASVVAEVRSALPEAHIVVVDDGSTDGTASRAAESGVEVLRLPFNVGVGGALRTAFCYARQADVDALIQIDADGQHDPASAVELLAGLREASIVVGSRFLQNPGFPVGRIRRITMVLLGRLMSSIVDTRLTDTTSGFRAGDRAAIALFADHYPAEYLGDTVESLVLAHRAGLAIKEVPAIMRPRQGGEPSQGLLRSVAYLGRAVLALALALGRPRPEVSR